MNAPAATKGYCLTFRLGPNTYYVGADTLGVFETSRVVLTSFPDVALVYWDEKAATRALDRLNSESKTFRSLGIQVEEHPSE
jgi:hypothetical protein